MLMHPTSTDHRRSDAQPDPPPQPKRVLGFRDLVMFYVVATLSLRWIAVAASAGPSSIVIWIIGLVTIFIPLALCVMELSSRYPQEGGMYVWSKRAFGDFAGFHHRLDLLDQQPAVFSGGPVFRGQQCAVCWRNEVEGRAGKPDVLRRLLDVRHGDGARAEYRRPGCRQVAEQPGRYRNVAADRSALRCRRAGVVEIWLGHQLQRRVAEAVLEHGHRSASGRRCCMPSAARSRPRSWAAKSRTRAAPSLAR